MKYTKEQLQAMSDFEVNNALAVLLGYRVQPLDVIQKIRLGVDSQAVQVDIKAFDYCNNPSDIMPMAFEHGVDYKRLPSTGKFAADYAYDITTHFIDANPLRAIACCLILVLQGNEE